MARGNHVDTLELIEKFGLKIVTPEFEGQTFDYYKEIYITKAGTLIGKWGNKPYEYKDYLAHKFWSNAILIRRTSKYLFFKI